MEWHLPSGISERLFPLCFAKTPLIHFQLPLSVTRSSAMLRKIKSFMKRKELGPEPNLNVRRLTHLSGKDILEGM